MLANDLPVSAGHDWVTESRLLINSRLDELLWSAHPSPVNAAMRYSVLAPGKRIRPLLTLAVADFLGGAHEDAMPIACSIEMIHCASLILDDLPCMDDDRERRSRLCTHIEFGESLTILAAVSLLTQSQCIVASHDRLAGELRLKLIQLLCTTVGPNGLSLGQYIDLKSKGDIPNPAAIADMHQLKTGILFQAAAKAGCLVSHASPEQEDKVMRFTTNLGLAFQMLDDIKDAGDDGTNIVARIGVRSARRKVQDYLQAAHAAIDGDGNAAVLRDLAETFFPGVAVNS